MSDYPMLISNKLHSFRNFYTQRYNIFPEEILKIKLRPYGRNAKRFRKARIREAGACA